MPPPQPRLETQRLLLRPFTRGDAPALAQVANDFKVADTTLAIVHPFDLQAALEWLAPLKEYYALSLRITWAITRKEDRALMGMVSLSTEESSRGIADLGYWLGSSYWGHGYATEAAGAAISWAFKEAGVNRVQAYHLTRNPSSGKVLTKLGFKHEGTRCQALRKWNKFEDIELYGLLKADYE